MVATVEIVQPATQNGKRSHRSKRPTDGKRKIAQLLDLQAILWVKAQAESTADKDRAALACAWERLENRLNRMRMKPEPKPCDVSPEAVAKRQRKRGYSQADADDREPQ